MSSRFNQACLLAACLATMGLAAPALAADAQAADQLIKDNKCGKCHALDRKKDGPAFRDIAAKFGGKPDAVEKVRHHLTAGDMVKFADGHQEKHKKVKADNDAEIKNLIDWILQLPGGTSY